MQQIGPQEVKEFQEKILAWYTQNKRDLPWRKTRDPYKILVSEIMLQQTQVQRVIPKYEAWLEAFPALQNLAQAKTAEVLRLWSGLGYNRRALYLQKTAKILVEKHQGISPQDEKILKTLPGIGEYTARAIVCFAFDKQVAVVDTNIKKVILTQIKDPKMHTLPKKEIQNFADQLLPKGKAYVWNQALMDYAAGMLKKEKIPIPKQSKFVGSDRYYRGKIIKMLLEKKKISITEVENLFKKTLQEKKRVKKIIASLVKDGMVKENGAYIMF